MTAATARIECETVARYRMTASIPIRVAADGCDIKLVVFSPSQRLEPTTGTLFQLCGGLAEGVHNHIVAGFVLVFGGLVVEPF